MLLKFSSDYYFMKIIPSLAAPKKISGLSRWFRKYSVSQKDVFSLVCIVIYLRLAAYRRTLSIKKSFRVYIYEFLSAISYNKII